MLSMWLHTCSKCVNNKLNYDDNKLILQDTRHALTLPTLTSRTFTRITCVTRDLTLTPHYLGTQTPGAWSAAIHLSLRQSHPCLISTMGLLSALLWRFYLLDWFENTTEAVKCTCEYVVIYQDIGLHYCMQLSENATWHRYVIPDLFRMANVKSIISIIYLTIELNWKHAIRNCRSLATWLGNNIRLSVQGWLQWPDNIVQLIGDYVQLHNYLELVNIGPSTYLLAVFATYYALYVT